MASKGGDRSPLDVALSVAGLAAQLATAGAMAYTVHRLASLAALQPEAPPQEPLSPRGPRPRRRSLGDHSPKAGAGGLARQLSPGNQAGAGVGGFVRQTSLTDIHHTAVLHQEEGGKPVAVAFEREGRSDVIIKDTPEAVTAMKAVFKRLCTSSKELLSCEDLEKVHELLGEPVDKSEVDRMLKFHGAKKPNEYCISFDMFMAWWSKLHDSTADPDKYYSQERYRQRFKVLQSRLKDPDIAKIRAVQEGEITSRRFRVHFEMEGVKLSPWHDIPLKNADGSYNFICEIPKWTRRKFEIATSEPMNPIKQDVKNGVLREYKWGDMLFNYGAFPQTWEDPKVVNEETGCPGDNDPVDVIELGTRQRPVGSITRVKIVGIIAMIDSDETDWKVLAVALDDDRAKNINDLQDLDAHMPGVTQALTQWLRLYKTAEGKKENKFGFEGKPQSAAFARNIVEETHSAWRQLLATASGEGKMKKVGSGHQLFTDLTVDAD